MITQRHPDKKAGGMWEFSGGGVLAGETTKQAAVRELEEEIGISIEEEVVDAKYVSDEVLRKMIEDKQIVWSVGKRYEEYRGKL